MADINVPYLNPVTYHELHPVQLPQYVSRSIEKFPFVDTIEEWEQATEFCQPWMGADTIRQQVTSMLSPVNMDVLDLGMNVVQSVQFAPIVQNVNKLGEWVYEHSLPLNSFREGIYFLRLSAGTSSPTILISEPIIISSYAANTLLLEFKHRQYKDGVFFETGFFPSMRFVGKLKLKSPGSDDTLYKNQPGTPSLIWSYPFELERLLVGSVGIPDYFIKRIARAFSCSFKSLDGTQYEKATENAQWEEASLEDYPMRGWALDVVKASYDTGQNYVNNVLQARRASIIAAVDTTGFSDSNTGSEQLVIVE